MRLIHLLLLLPALILVGCPGDDDDDDSAAPEPVVGRVHVLGGGTFETIQEAIDAAPTGGTVTLDPGCYDEAFEITKGISLSGDTPDTTVITGGGEGIVGVVDSVVDPVTIANLRLYAPFDSPGTLRTLRVTSSVDVVLNNLAIGFEMATLPEADPDICARAMPEGSFTLAATNGYCSQGLLGVEVSQANLLASEVDIQCVGYQNASGGTGVLVQTDSTLTITDSSIGFVGSFGIRTIDSTLTVNDVEINQVLRDESAQDFESNGSGIFVEAGTGEALVDGLTVTNGVFVGLWVEAPRLTVSNSYFEGFNYGIYMPGDNASASGRTLTLTNSVFKDLRNDAVIASASSTLVGNDFSIDALAGNGGGNGGALLQGVGTIQDVRNNDFFGHSNRGLGIFGDNNDGNVAQATVEGNTVTNTVAGNGISVRWVDEALVNGNVIDGVDHAYNDDPNNPGGITNGFGIDCFYVGSCELTGNSITGSEFANIVVVDSTFSSTDDVLRESWSRAIHIEGSTAVITNPTVTDSYGFGILGVDSTILGSGGVIADQLRGPSFTDIDGFEDPLPEEIVYIQGGTALQMQSGGAPSLLQWSDGTFADSENAAITALDSQVELLGNSFLNSGFMGENGFFPSSAVWISGNDPFAASGPRVRNNVLDGGEGSWGLYINDAPDAQITGNTLCVGSSAGLYMRDSGGSLIEDNLFGNTEDPEVAACDLLDWQRGIYISGSDPGLDQGVTIRENTIDSPMLDYGVYMTGMGEHLLADNAIGATLTAAVYATMSLPNGLTMDTDGDNRRIHEGDCNDNDVNIGFLNATELPGDLVDNDCDGVADDGLDILDNDGDGVTIADGDCNDTDDTIFPGQPETPGNGVDDNCDGWADFDADYALPVVTLSGNTIDQAADAIWMSGATAVLTDPEVDEEPNLITGTTNRGVYLTDWQWSGSPLYSPGGLVMGAETELLGTGGHCIQALATGVQMELNGTTLQDCGNNGIDLSSSTSAALNGVVISGATGSGVRAASGLVTGTGLTVTGATNSGVLVTGSVVELDALNVTGGSQGAQVTGGSLTVGGGTIASVSGAAFQVSGGEVSLTDVTVTDPGAQALNTTAGLVTVAGGAFVNPVGEGVRVSGAADVTADGLAISGSTLQGYRLDAGTLTLVDGSVTDAGEEGILAAAGVLSVDGTTITGATGDGISLEGFTTVDVTNATLETSGGFGLTCDGGVSDPLTSQVDLAVCTATATGNVDGDFELFNGCELVATCEAPVP